MKLKKREVSALNIDDYILQQKRKGVTKISWSTKAWNILYSFAVVHIPQSIGSEITYMGIKHYRHET